MAKININFNNKTYSVDESVLSAATADLRTHFSTTMSGTGASIKFGGNSYNIDSTKLSTAKNDFVAHLRTIAGNGSSVVVDGVEYGIDSSKVSNAISALKNTFDDLQSGSNKSNAGLYQNGVMVKSWDELISEGIITIEDGSVISSNADFIDGDLVGADDITVLREDAFNNCINLTAVNFPNVRNVQRAFVGCHALKSVELPVAYWIHTEAFLNCTALETVILPSCKTIGDAAFWGCTSLKTLILSGENLCYVLTGILNTGIIGADGMPTGTGFVYVPTSLYESYIADLVPQIVELSKQFGLSMDESTATYLASSILRKIEDYPEICNPSSPDAPSEERLEGDGAEYYTLAPTALSFRSSAPLNELQEIQINGVTVDPSNYTLEEGSTIVTFPIDYLKTLNVGNYEVNVVSDSKTVKGGFTVSAPELNEYGFYYNQPYSANLPMFGGDTAFFVREDGTYDIITVGKLPDTSEYTMDGNNIVATHPMLGMITCTISSNGTEVFCNELQTAFKLSNSTAIAADEDYVYVYKEDLGGYEVQCIDKTQAEYGDIKTGINGIDTVKLAINMFADNASLIVSPAIPNSITHIDSGVFSHCTNMTKVEIPNSVIILGQYAFSDCISLTTITFDGTIEQWNAIDKEIYWLGLDESLIPATHVQCSDGQVEL